MKIISIILFCFLIVGCTNNSEDIETKKELRNKHLNINILLDLSNRIDSTKNPLHPSQIERDKTIIRSFIAAFKRKVESDGAFSAKSKIRIFFHPEPDNNEIVVATRKLNVSCIAGNKQENAKHNKEIYKSIENDFSTALDIIYNSAINQGKYPGANIWRFIKDDVRLKCIEDTSEFRNILVILTDGYMYYENDLIREGNRYNYIERNYEHFTKFRNLTSLEEQFHKDDFGFIKANTHLDELEVMIMEVAPNKNLPADYDIIKMYWEKWLSEMGVGHYSVVKTQQPAYLDKIIIDFLDNN